MSWRSTSDFAIEDIRHAADALRPVYEATEAPDGYVSLEVSPYLAMNTEATIAEARRLWQAVGRDNLMIKVPGTKAGLPAIRQLIGEGINVNITLLFSQQVYEEVVEAYLAGLEHLVAQGGDPGKVASVASFFVSRIDVAVDKLIEERLARRTPPASARRSPALRGKVAIANAKLAYQRYKRLFAGAALGEAPRQGRAGAAAAVGEHRDQEPGLQRRALCRGADRRRHRQHHAARDHGRVSRSWEGAGEPRGEYRPGRADHGDAGAVRHLDRRGDGQAGRGRRAALRRCFRQAARRGRAQACRAPRRASSTARPASLRRSLKRRSPLRSKRGGMTAMCAGSGPATRACGPASDEAKWLGWLGIVEAAARADRRSLAPGRGCPAAGISPTSCCSAWADRASARRCLRETFGRQNGRPELLVLDSTDPAQIRTIESKIDPARTLFIVSSKSGSTLEPNILKQYFFECAKRAVGADRAGSRFIAITDPGSKLQEIAERDRFRHIAFGVPSIGGRYSVLSDFGMVPAAAMGLDVGRLLDRNAEDGALLRRQRAAGRKSRRRARDHPGRAGEVGPRQGHHRRLARHRRFRRMARAAAGGIDRQAGQGAHPGRCRAARAAGGLRAGPPVRLYAADERGRCRAG